MAKLTSKRRNSLAAGKFALPAERKYPIPDKSHAANAKARAEQQAERGKISTSTRDRIDAAANRVLKKGTKSKAKTSASRR
jgi:hypothetical protein